MRRRFRRDKHSTDEDRRSATARVDVRTKDLVGRLLPGEIAIINHEDIDRVAAEGLIQAQVRGVVNASRSISGRYPNLGPLLLVSAGIPVLDAAGEEVMDVVEGTQVMIDGDRLVAISGSDSNIVAKGRPLDLEDVEKRMDEAKRGIVTSLERFAENTIEYIKDERDVLLEALHLPEVRTEFNGRHVLIVVRGYDYKEDLQALRAYIRELDPLLVAVDGGADALLDLGLKPDMIIGDMDSVTTEALLSGAEIVVHAYPGGFAPGLERIHALGISDAVIYEAQGTSEDIAMLLAYENAAELIVAVGTHVNLIEFLDKGRKGMASTFLVRLRVGSILVDAKGVSRLYRGRIRRKDLGMLIGAAVVALVVAFLVSDVLRLEVQFYWERLQNWWFDIRQTLFS